MQLKIIKNNFNSYIPISGRFKKFLLKKIKSKALSFKRDMEGVYFEEASLDDRKQVRLGVSKITIPSEYAHLFSSEVNIDQVEDRFYLK